MLVQLNAGEDGAEKHCELHEDYHETGAEESHVVGAVPRLQVVPAGLKVGIGRFRSLHE